MDEKRKFWTTGNIIFFGLIIILLIYFLLIPACFDKYNSPLMKKMYPWLNVNKDVTIYDNNGNLVAHYVGNIGVINDENNWIRIITSNDIIRYYNYKITVKELKD